MLEEASLGMLVYLFLFCCHLVAAIFFLKLVSFFFQACHIFVVNVSTFQGMQIGSLDSDNSSVKVPRKVFAQSTKNNTDGEYVQTSLKSLLEYKGTAIVILTTYDFPITSSD